MNEKPEIKCARLLIKRKKLIHPIDIFDIVQEYATLEFDSIPERIDGLCLHPKDTLKRKVIINTELSPRRKVFTAAHELAHIVLPWHISSVADNLDEGDAVTNYQYRAEEAEANRFASEILMPKDWIIHLHQEYGNPKDISEYIYHECSISMEAITIKLNEYLPTGYTYARIKNNQVLWSGTTRGTVANALRVGEVVDDLGSLFTIATNSWEIEHHSELYKWWYFGEIDTPNTDDIDWRSTLNEIFDDLGLQEKKKQLWPSLNSHLAAASQKSDNTIDSLHSTLHQKKLHLGEHNDLGEISRHAKFDYFLVQKSHDLFSKRQNNKNTAKAN